MQLAPSWRDSKPALGMKSQGAGLFSFSSWGAGGDQFGQKTGLKTCSCTQGVDVHGYLSPSISPSTPKKLKTKTGRKRGPNIQIPKVPHDKVGCVSIFFIFTYKQKCHNNKPKQRLSLLLRSQCGLAGRVIYKPAGDSNSALSRSRSRRSFGTASLLKETRGL